MKSIIGSVIPKDRLWLSALGLDLASTLVITLLGQTWHLIPGSIVTKREGAKLEKTSLGSAVSISSKLLGDLKQNEYQGWVLIL